MSKFNNNVTMKTTNKSGHVAYKMQDKEKLVSMVLTTMFGEPKFYGDNSSELVKLAEEICQYDPEFVSRLAVYARNVFNMRSVSHVLTCIVAHFFYQFNKGYWVEVDIGWYNNGITKSIYV